VCRTVTSDTKQPSVIPAIQPPASTLQCVPGRGPFSLFLPHLCSTLPRQSPASLNSECATGASEKARPLALFPAKHRPSWLRAHCLAAGWSPLRYPSSTRPKSWSALRAARSTTIANLRPLPAHPEVRPSPGGCRLPSIAPVAHGVLSSPLPGNFAQPAQAPKIAPNSTPSAPKSSSVAAAETLSARSAVACRSRGFTSHSPDLPSPESHRRDSTSRRTLAVTQDDPCADAAAACHAHALQQRAQPAIPGLLVMSRP
jgi:hypothetical protein